MSKIINNLTPSQHESTTQEREYRLDDIKALPHTTVTEVHEGIYLAILTEPEYENVINFACFEWASSEAGTSSEADRINVTVNLVFQGWGTGGNLNEMRHTYWGPVGDGYTFYLPIDGTIAALTALKQYFKD